MGGSTRSKYTLEIDDKVYELTEAGLTGVLFEFVTTLVFEKLARRVTYILKGKGWELSGAGGGRIPLMAINLYRHLKEQRCPAPLRTDLPGEAQSFRLHSVVDALLAAAFYRMAGEFAPHFILDDDLGNELLRIVDRGRRSRLTVGDADLRARLISLVPGADQG